MKTVGNDEDGECPLPAIVLARRSATARKRGDKLFGSNGKRVEKFCIEEETTEGKQEGWKKGRRKRH